MPTMERDPCYQVKFHYSNLPPYHSKMADSTARSTRRRASTPRSKKGCITCKIRRLKCGEEKPGCVRCAKSGWNCDGYEHLAESSSSQASQSRSSKTLHPILPRFSSQSAAPSFSPRSVGDRSLSPSMASNHGVSSLGFQVPTQLNHQEQRYFQVFLDEVPVSLLGTDPFFWKNVAVQESHTTASVRHAIVALGALIKSTAKSASGNYILDVNEAVHRQFALQQHEKSIRGLREAIGSQESTDSTRSVVVSCLVLARLEPFIGNGGFAMQHIRYARKILFRASGNEVRVPPLFSNNSDPNDVAINMFFQSDLQALAALGPEEDRSSVGNRVEAPNTSIAVPALFRDFEEASQYIKILCGEGHKFWYRLSLQHTGSWDGASQTTLGIRDYFLHQIHLLHAALDDFAAEKLIDLDIHPLQRPSSMKHYSTYIFIKLSLTLDAPETSADLLLPYFQYLVAKCREVIDFEQRNEFSAGHESFAFESRIIGPLFLTATKCRDANLRREAISLLLSSHRRELMWDSITVGNVSHWIMTIEEEGMDAIGYISDENRAWGHSMELDLQRRITLVKCRVGGKALGQWIERSTEIPYNEILT